MLQGVLQEQVLHSNFAQSDKTETIYKKAMSKYVYTYFKEKSHFGDFPFTYSNSINLVIFNDYGMLLQ